MKLYLLDNIRDRHTYIVGMTGCGKSTLILNMAIQDIIQGKGVAVIDPDGDLAEALLNLIPKIRVPDTLYFSKETPLPLSVMDTKDEEAQDLADDLIVTFHRLSEGRGERMDALLRYCVHTLSRVPGSTFLDIHRLITNPGWRGDKIKNLPPELRNFWTKEFPHYRPLHYQPILTRMAKFMLSPALRSILGAPKGLDLSQLMQEKKVLIANLGKLGQDEGKLVGSLFVSRFQIAIRRRANLKPAERIPYYLYVDEFQDFVASPFHQILSRARKFKMCLTVAHQFISQLDGITRDAIIGNVGTFFVFQVGPIDAPLFRALISPYKPEHLIDLPPHWALLLSQRQKRFIQTPRPPGAAQSYREEIIRQSRTYVARPLHPPQKQEHSESEAEDEIKPSAPPVQAHRPEEKDPGAPR